jgi:hypothetical protein
LWHLPLLEEQATQELQVELRFMEHLLLAAEAVVQLLLGKMAS